MASMRVTATMLDGTKHEAIGVFMALSDRIAFEKRFDSSFSKMQADRANVREEESAYFAWRTLTRAECAVGGFEDFIEAVEEVELERLDGPVDPTDPAPPPGMLPS